VKPHLSVTQLNMLSRCGLQYDFRYIQKIIAPPGVQLVIGKGTHAAIEKDLVNKQQWGTLLPDDSIADYAADAARAAWDEDEPVLQEGDPDKGGVVDVAVSLAQLHHKQVAPGIDPVAIERGFVLEIEGFPYDLMGFVDIEEPGRIRDTKTSSKSPPADAAEQSDQLTLYHLEAVTRGLPPPMVQLDYLVKTKVPKAVSLSSVRGPEDHARFLRRVEVAARVIEAGSFQPAAPDSWACSQKWCGYWDRCAFGSRGRVSVGLIDPARLTSRMQERRP
jgi:hypothetical protein